jgi:quercetin dioxygenase-like cupin family protein
MRKARLVGFLLVSLAALGQQGSVEITSEPSHHQVLTNGYVRVFDVTVAPKATTLVHRHNYDYLFVTLGDSDVVSTRPGEKPVALKLKDGEVRYTPGHFAHSAGNQSDRPFHNITIELLMPATNVKTCTEACSAAAHCSAGEGHCPTVEKRISSDQWTVSMWSLPPGTSFEPHFGNGPALLVAVTALDLAQEGKKDSGGFRRSVGGLYWIGRGQNQKLTNLTSRPQTYVTLEFNQEAQ